MKTIYAHFRPFVKPVKPRIWKSVLGWWVCGRGKADPWAYASTTPQKAYEGWLAVQQPRG